MDLVVQFIVAVFATIAFAVLFSVPKKELAFCGFTGALGWIIYSVFMKFDMGIVLSQPYVLRSLQGFSQSYGKLL